MSTCRKFPFMRIGSFVSDCVASQWNKIRPSVSFAIRARRSMGKTTPVSLLACMTVTKSVSSSNARTYSSKSRLPWRSTPRKVTSQPSRAISRQTSITAACSTLVAMMRRRPGTALTVPPSRLFQQVFPFRDRVWTRKSGKNKNFPKNFFAPIFSV